MRKPSPHKKKIDEMSVSYGFGYNLSASYDTAVLERVDQYGPGSIRCNSRIQ
jgi:hypothetical protein